MVLVAVLATRFIIENFPAINVSAGTEIASHIKDHGFGKVTNDIFVFVQADSIGRALDIFSTVQTIFISLLAVGTGVLMLLLGYRLIYNNWPEILWKVIVPGWALLLVIPSAVSSGYSDPILYMMLQGMVVLFGLLNLTLALDEKIYPTVPASNATSTP